MFLSVQLTYSLWRKYKAYVLIWSLAVLLMAGPGEPSQGREKAQKALEIQAKDTQ